MNDALSIRRILISHYFFSGIGAAIGVIAIALLSAYGLNLRYAAAIASGALCVSIVDLPAVPAQKAYQAIAATLLCMVGFLSMSITRGATGLELLVILGVSGAAALLHTYGKKAMPVAFSMVFSMIIALGSPQEDLHAIAVRSLLFSSGAVAYSVWAVCLSMLLSDRTKRQALSECLFTLGHYMRLKARFYEDDADLDACYQAVVRYQSVVAEKQQQARDFVLRQVSTSEHRRLVAQLLATLDVYEAIFASHTDYADLQRAFGGTDVIAFLKDLALKGARDLEELGYQVVSFRRVARRQNYRAEIYAIEHFLDVTTQRGTSVKDVAVLRGVFARIRQVTERINGVYDVDPTAIPGILLEPQTLKTFRTPNTFHIRLLWTQIQERSAFARFAVRFALAMGCGFLITHALPSSHSYWVLLTIGVIMRSNFSLTRQRRADRTVGTVLGCIFSAGLLHLHPSATLLLASLFCALVVAHTYVTLRYRYTAAAACVMALIQVQFINPGSGFAIDERLIDTAVGAAVAWIFSFVLPSWERSSVMDQARALLSADIGYLQTLASGNPGSLDYRLARKRLFDSMALFSGAYGRMLAEPPSQHRASGEFNRLASLNYSFAAQLAGINMLVARRQQDLAQLGVVEELKQTADRAGEALSSAEAALLGDAEVELLTASTVQAPGATADLDWGLLTAFRRRLQALEASARDLQRLCGTIGRKWKAGLP